MELSAIEEQLATQSQNTLFHASEVELTETTRLLLEAIDRAKPTRVAFDSLSELRLLSETPLRYRRQILSFKQILTGRNCTTLMLDDNSAAASDTHVLSLAHGVIVMEQLALKIRGATYRDGFHDYVIETGGIAVFPRLVAAEHHWNFPDENVTSGIEGLDGLLGGGLARGTSTLFSGPPGSGKSNLALTFAVAAAKRGEKVAIYTFDESLPILRTRARSRDGFGAARG